jgi:cell division septal protein FtsQ
MGVLDRQSIRRDLRNRRVGTRAGSRRPTVPDRRREGRGAPSQSQQALRASRRAAVTGTHESVRRRRRQRSVAGTLGAAARVLLTPLLLPVLLLSALARPGDLVRRLVDAPDRMRSRSRRLRHQARDPDTTAGKVAHTARITAWYLREELHDMSGGFPSPPEVARWLGARSAELLEAIGLRIGLVPRGPHDDSAGERVFGAVALGIVGAAVFLGLFLAGYQALEAAKGSEQLALERIAVLGLDRVAEADVLARLPVRPGANLIELEADKLGGRIEGLAWVDTVDVRLNLRQRALEVLVVEHRPALLLVDGGLKLVDERGRAFKALESGDPADLPLLSIDGWTGDAERLERAALGALDILRAARAGRAVRASDVSEIRWEGEGRGFSVVTRAGLPVVLGTEDFAARLGRVERAVASGRMPLDAVASIDAGLRDRLVAMPRARPKARKTLRKAVEAQPVQTVQRNRMIHLDRIRRTVGAATDFDWSTP